LVVPGRPGNAGDAEGVHPHERGVVGAEPSEGIVESVLAAVASRVVQIEHVSGILIAASENPSSSVDGHAVCHSDLVRPNSPHRVAHRKVLENIDPHCSKLIFVHVLVRNAAMRGWLSAREHDTENNQHDKMSLVVPEKFQHILRILNTNIDGKRKVMFAMTSIKGVGRRFANIVLKKADIDLDKRAGECSEEEVEKIVTIMQNPRQFKIPDWFLNRQKDIQDGKYSQLTSSFLDSKLRDDLERLKKIRAHRGLRHFWGLRVRGQHTKTTGRRGRTVGVSKKK